MPAVFDRSFDLPESVVVEVVYTNESSNSHAQLLLCQGTAITVYMLSYEYLYAVMLRTTHYRYASRNVQTLLQSTVQLVSSILQISGYTCTPVQVYTVNYSL